MSQAPIWPVAIDAFVADTTHLSAEETGAYMMLLMGQWRNNGKPLPLNHKKLARMARVAPQRWKKIWHGIEGFYEIDGELITQKRLRNDWSRVQKKISSNRRNASIGGKAKALKTKETSLADATISAERKGAIGLPNHEPEPNPDIFINKKGLAGKEFPEGSIHYTGFDDIARQHGNGWDVNVVANDFRAWAVAKKIKPENMARAFPGFCKSYAKNKGPA